MKVFYAGRPYQLFNNINYAITNSITADIIISNEYQQAKNDFVRVQAAGIFHKVYFVDESTYRNKSKLSEIIYIFKRGLFPSALLRQIIVEPEFYAKEHNYDEIFSSAPSGVVQMLQSVYKSAKYTIIEDGTGTYAGKDFLENQSLKHRLYCAVFRNGAMNVKIDRVLVYKPEMCRTSISKNIEALPRIDESNKHLVSVLNHVFSYQNIAYRKKIIVLSQRLLGLNCRETDLYTYIMNAFRSAGIMEQDICYRLHPAEKEEDYVGRVHCDASDMWELICMRYVKNDSILITINSTAVFSPYKLYNKEPYIVFLYKLIGLHEHGLLISDNLVLELKKQYVDPNRILVPDSDSELIAILRKLQTEVGGNDHEVQEH